MCNLSSSSCRFRQSFLCTMVNDLLSELDQLAQRNKELLHCVRAAKATLQDTRTQDNMDREDQACLFEKTTMQESFSDEHLPDRRARASSCIIPPSLQLRIGAASTSSGSAESVLSSPLQLPSLSDASPHEQSGSPARPQSPRHQRAMTLPNLHKPLPPTPRTPQWPLCSPTASIKGSHFVHDYSNPCIQFDDESALLLNNISFESEAASQLPFVPGQSYVRLPRRITEEEVPRSIPPAPPPRPGTSAPATIAPGMPHPSLDDPGVIALNTTPVLETQTLPDSSPSRRLKKKFEDYLPRSILPQKPKHERARTLSPSRTPSPNRMLSIRARSTHDLKKMERRGVRFAD